MNRYLRLFLLCIALLTTVAANGSHSAPPLGIQWRIPQRVPGYHDEASAPYLVADQNRTVHAFNSVLMNKDLVIVYNQWTKASGWTTPNDVLLSPWKREARLKGAFLDTAGRVHLVFWGGDDLSAAIFYSQAPLVHAASATAWSKNRLVGEIAIAPSEAALTGDGKNNLYIVYSGARDGVGLYAVYSTDGGETWTEPSIVYLVPEEGRWPTSLELEIDDRGYVHAVWTLVNSTGNGDFIYYAHLDPATRQWSDAKVLATRTPGEYEVDWPSIVAYNNELIVVYDDSAPATRWMRRSVDGGLTWFDPVLPFDYVGEYGHASFVIDSNNYLHMFLGNRTRDATHGMWHSVWLDGRWSDLEPIVSGPRVTDGSLAVRFDPSAPQAVISQGNVILVTWATDPGAGRNGVWYSYATLDAPEFPLLSLPTPEPEPTATSQAMVSAGAVQPAVPQKVAVVPGADIPGQPSYQTPSTLLVAGALAAAVLILSVIVIFGLRLQARH